jgi:hypothetical protein
MALTSSFVTTLSRATANGASMTYPLAETEWNLPSAPLLQNTRSPHLLCSTSPAVCLFRTTPLLSMSSTASLALTLRYTLSGRVGKSLPMLISSPILLGLYFSWLVSCVFGAFSILVILYRHFPSLLPDCLLRSLAERGRFELPIGFRLCRFSKPVPSTTQPPLQSVNPSISNQKC